MMEYLQIENFRRSNLSDGIVYSIEMTNLSNETIVQNNIYVSFPIVNDDKTKSTMNKCKVETTGNKLNIEPKEVVVLNAFMPKENYQDAKSLHIQNPQIQIKGYLNELKDLNHFEINTSFSYFDKDFESKYVN